MAGIGKPRIYIENITVTKVSLSEIGLLVTVAIENSNPVSIPVQQIDFDLFGVIGGKERAVAHGQHGDHHIPPGKSTLAIPVIIQNQEIIGALSEFLLARSMDLRITGNARVGLGIMSYNVPISEERRFSF